MWLHDGPSGSWPAKARVLAEAAVAGLPVPRGVVISLRAEPLPAVVSALTRLVSSGTVIARSALWGEDEPGASAAGLGQSRSGLESVEAVVDAVAAMRKALDDPFLEFYRGPAHGNDAVIIQRQVTRRRLVVGALLPDATNYIEVHTGAGDVLATGASPVFAGRLDRWDDRTAATVRELVARARATFDAGDYGLDIELVVDDKNEAQLVQLRPLTAPLSADGDAFVAAVRAAGQLERLEGDLTLDAEHNPAPLSPAHAWVMDWLAQQRPKAGEPRVLAGWLYVRTLVRELATSRGEPPTSGVALEPTPAMGPARTALAQLVERLLPAARTRLEQIDLGLVSADTFGVAKQLRRAMDAFLAMIDAYLDVLVPARKAAGHASAARTDKPLSTLGREAFADVLPAAWDVASPTLGELHRFEHPGRPPAVPDDEAEATVLLTEWDDHLFALGLAPLRRAYLTAGQLLGLGAEDVFLLTVPELEWALADRDALKPETVASRREQQAVFAALRPPLRIEDGRPTPLLRHAHLRGLPIGLPTEGTIAQRRDLEDLLRRPPEAGAVVVLPALTAQAALALQQFGVTAVCCEYGGAMSHAALMARELGLSALIGCQGCTRVEDGVPARVDTVLGRLLVAS